MHAGAQKYRRNVCGIHDSQILHPAEATRFKARHWQSSHGSGKLESPKAKDALHDYWHNHPTHADFVPFSEGTDLLTRNLRRHLVPLFLSLLVVNHVFLHFGVDLGDSGLHVRHAVKGIDH
jgi:hypothetical protein